MVSSPDSQRSRSVSTTNSRRANSRSRSRTAPRSYSRSPSQSGSFSAHSSHSGRSSRSKSRRDYSRSRSDSSVRSGSWSRSRSRDHSVYSSRSRSVSRSRSRSVHRSSRRRSFYRSRTRSRSYESRPRTHSRSHSGNTASPEVRCSGKDPRDRSKRLKWSNNIWIIGEKAKDTVFHFCDICDLPVVIYGRLLPCKHVLCYACAMNLPNKCNRCQKAVQSVERCLVGGIFMCFESDGCRRTYLSQRDLQAHIDHRHRNGKAFISTTSTTLVTTATVCDSVNTIETSITTLPAHQNSEDGVQRKTEVIKISNSLDNVMVSNTISLLGTGTLRLPTTNTSGLPNFLTNSKNNNGLLPLPPQLSTSNMVMPALLSAGVRQTNSSNLPPMRPFPPAPVMPPQSIATPSFLRTSIPPPPIPLNRGQTLPGASAVAALAAVVSAAMCAQSKSQNNLSVSLQQSMNTNNSLQANALNASLITNALRMANPNWNTTTSTATTDNNSNVNSNNNTSNNNTTNNDNIDSGGLNLRSNLINRPMQPDMIRGLRF